MVMENDVAKVDLPSSNPRVDSFLLLAKSASGSALKALVQQVLETNGLYVFGEILNCNSIQQMKDGDEETKKYWDLLNIFAYGKYRDYLSQSSALPSLTPIMVKKLRHLTLIAVSSKCKYVPYKTLMEELDMDNLRDLENLLISAVYADVIRGRLDQQNSRLEVHWTAGRDLRPEDITGIIDTLESWCSSCQSTLGGIESQVMRANTFLSENNARKAQLSTEVDDILLAIKKNASETEVPDSSLSSPTPSSSVSSDFKSKKVKTKGRPMGMKLWSNKN